MTTYDRLVLSYWSLAAVYVLAAVAVAVVLAALFAGPPVPNDAATREASTHPRPRRDRPAARPQRVGPEISESVRPVTHCKPHGLGPSRNKTTAGGSA